MSEKIYWRDITPEMKVVHVTGPDPVQPGKTLGHYEADGKGVFWYGQESEEAQAFMLKRSGHGLIDHLGRVVSIEYIRTLQLQQANWDRLPRFDQQMHPRGNSSAFNWRGYASLLDELAEAYERAGMRNSAESTRRHAQDLRALLSFKEA